MLGVQYIASGDQDLSNVREKLESNGLKADYWAPVFFKAAWQHPH